MRRIGTGNWQAPLALVLGIGLTAMPGVWFSMLLPLHMQRLAVVPSAIALFQPIFGVGVFLAALPAAALVARYGPRRAFPVALVLVTALTLGMVLPVSYLVLGGLRGLQGMASAGLLAAGLALVRPVFGQARLGPGFGLATMAGALCGAVLSVASGMGYAHLGLPGLVAPGLMLAVAAGLLGWMALPEAPPESQRFDGLGALLCLVGFGLILAVPVFVVVQPVRALELAILGLLVGIVWIWQQGRLSSPLLPLDLLARPQHRCVAGAAFLGGLAVTSLYTVGVPHLLVAWHLLPERLGPLLLPATVVAGLAAAAGGWATARWPRWQPAATGAVLLAIGLGGLVQPRGGSEWGSAVALAALLVTSAGRGLLECGNALGLVGGAPTGRIAAAAGLLIGAGAMGGLVGQLLVALPSVWNPEAPWISGLDATALGLTLAGAAALAAAWLSVRAARRR